LAADTAHFVLTGTGISHKAGLAALRDAAESRPVSGSRNGDARSLPHDPGRVQTFYNARRRHLQNPSIKPNAAHHRGVAMLEAHRPGDVMIATQNIDDGRARRGRRAGWFEPFYVNIVLD
jgi:NAD-dependent deacetylase